VLVLHSDNLEKLPGVAHGFFGRKGGVSRGIYESLNCGPGSADDTAHVIENRRRVRSALGAEALNTLYQVHSASTVNVAAPWAVGPHGDAMVTKTINRLMKDGKKTVAEKQFYICMDILKEKSGQNKLQNTDCKKT
jgi:copper oxidase (laccase) domain-containing protein